MATRSREQQSRHDQKVRKVAEDLRKQGWDVEADLPGYNEREPI